MKEIGVDYSNFKTIMDKIFILHSVIHIINFIFLIQISFNVHEIDKYFKLHQHFDYETTRDLDECYLTIHNFVSFNSTFDIQPNANFSESTNINVKNVTQKQSFHTYISSYNKPFLLEMVQNATNDCLCCN